MSQESNLSEQMAALAKKVESEAKFTRVLSLVLTGTVIGVMFYLTTEIVSSLPQMIFTMGQVQAVAKAKHELMPAPAATNQK